MILRINVIPGICNIEEHCPDLKTCITVLSSTLSVCHGFTGARRQDPGVRTRNTRSRHRYFRCQYPQCLDRKYTVPHGRMEVTVSGSIGPRTRYVYRFKSPVPLNFNSHLALAEASHTRSTSHSAPNFSLVPTLLFDAATV